MKVYSGLEYTYKVEECIKDCIQKAKDNPFSKYIFVVDDPRFFEEICLRHTDTLFSIEIMTFSNVLNTILQQKNKAIKKVSKLQAVLTLRKIMLEYPTIYNQSASLFSMIGQLLSLFQEFAYEDIQECKDIQAGSLSKEKIAAAFFLYHKFLAALPINTPFMLEKEAMKCLDTPLEDTHYIFFSESVINPLDLSFLKKLDTVCDVTLLAPFQEDERLLNTVYQKYFATYTRLENPHQTPYITSTLHTLFTNTKVPKLESSPLSCFIASTPKQEIEQLCVQIHEKIVNQNMRYHDFAIYYPNNQYLEMLCTTLNKFSIPHNAIKEPIFASEMLACTFLLQYASTNDEKLFIAMLDTLTMRTYFSSMQVDFLKKQWQEYRYIENIEYQNFKEHIINTYMQPIQQAKTMATITKWMLTFIKEEMIANDITLSITHFFTSLQEYPETCTLLEFIELIEYLKPTFSSMPKEKQDHLYLFTYTQPYSGLLGIENMYLVGLNETIVPSSIKDEGILLDKERSLINGLSTLSTMVAKQQNQILQVLTSSSVTITLSYALTSNSGETLLPSSLLQQLKTLYPIHSFTIENTYHPALPHTIYLEGGKDRQLTTINTIIANFTQTKNQPANIFQPILPRALSASQLETYNGCPYKYFHQYTLKLQPFNTPILQANEIGTLVHHLIEINSDCFASQEKAKTCNTASLPALIEQQVQEYLLQQPILQKKIQHTINRYFIDCLTQDMYNTLCILIKQMQVSSFSLHNTEEKVLTDYGDFKIQGVIDRVDTYRNYVKVVDYKSSNKELDLNLALQGFNMQMLIYIDMLAKQQKLDKGALLYFNTKKRILKSSASILEDVDSEDFFKEYRMNGYVDEEVIEDIDHSIDGSSSIIKVKYVKSKEGYTGNILQSDSFNHLVKEIEKHIYTLYQSMVNGVISITPKGSYDTSMHTAVNPCSYCNYRSLCHFDVFYNEYEQVQKLDVKNILGGAPDGKNQ